jgi:hypothetical protein
MGVVRYGYALSRAVEHVVGTDAPEDDLSRQRDGVRSEAHTMRFPWLPAFAWIAHAVIASLVTCPAVHAEEELTAAPPPGTFAAQEGFYIGVARPYNSISGDFNGNQVVIGTDDIFLLPTVKSSYGTGILIGVRSVDSAIELSYLRSKHDATWLGTKTTEATFQVVNVDYKKYFFVEHRIQPYILIGWVPLAQLTIKDASTNATSVNDASFQSFFINFNFGGGIAFYAHPRISLYASMYYRYLNFTSVKGSTSKWANLDDNLDGSGTNYSMGITFTF